MIDDAGWIKVIEQLRKEMREIIPVQRDVPQGALYHYTNSVGLEGILRSGCIRLTHFE